MYHVLCVQLYLCTSIWDRAQLNSYLIIIMWYGFREVLICRDCMCGEREGERQGIVMMPYYV